MDYRSQFEKLSDYEIERLELSRQRVAQIAREGIGPEPYSAFFRKTAAFLGKVYQAFEERLSGKDRELSLEELRERNHALYQDILPGKDGYDKSYANPSYAAEMLGEPFARMLCFLASEMRAAIAAAYEGNFPYLLIFPELFLQCACLFEEGVPKKEALEKAIYWFYHDYSELFAQQSVRGNVDPSLSFAADLVREEELSDLRYLYRYGEYISKTEEQAAAFLNTLPEEEIRRMADAYTEGYRKGFELAGISLAEKKTVNVRYSVGFERVVRTALENFDKMGLKPTIYRAATFSYFRRGTEKIGYSSLGANLQYEFDHAHDQALYLDKSFANRRLEALEAAYGKYEELAGTFAGPACMEIFGEPQFDPVIKAGRLDYTEKQQKLLTYIASESGRITNTYIPGDKRSFTIIAWPIPSIGKDFEAIFRETVKINTLDYESYRKMQQCLVDALDEGYGAHIKGRGSNETDLVVRFWKLQDPSKETIFENCLADVNIPVGEVFTSPVLEGTGGVLHVSKVYLDGLEYRDLKITLKDGFVTDYTLSNFEDPEENKKFFRSNVLFNHETLPLGEFAIGTNTTAYRMGKDYGISGRLPILIAEKTGPHFALGDTCYSYQEDMVTYNPDGKKIVARENAVSRLRRTDPEKAYFNCHTDITIPFEELGCIEVLHEDGTKTDLIRDGRFVLPGTEELNGPLEGIV